MKKWLVASKNGKFVDYLNITDLPDFYLRKAQVKLLNKHDHQGFGVQVVEEEEAQQVIECHNYPEMALLARVKVSHNTFDEQTAEFRRLRKKYPKCSVGYSQWRPGLTYFES